jgi:rubrerythrin
MDTRQFNIDEVFELAEQIERNGAKFYRAASDGLDDAGQRALLGELAAMEDEHERTFANMRARLARDLQRESVYEVDDQARQYLWAWVENAVFDMSQDPLAVLKDADIEKILKTAIQREKESIVFYEGLKGGIDSDDDRKKVDAIIGEEMKHIGLLTRQLHQLKA